MAVTGSTLNKVRRALRVEEWRLLNVETPEDAAMNLAIDEAIFIAMMKKVAPPTVRFWRNARAVVVGYSQKVEAEINLALCEKENIQIVRRFTGGGTVYQDLGNLNYTIVVDASHRLIRGLDIAESYKVLCSGMVEGLRDVGIAAAFRPLSDICVGDKKISGSAQSRKKGIALHHGTVLVNSDLDMLVNVLDISRKDREGKKATSIRKPVTRLKDELSLDIDMATVKKALARGFERAFSITLTQGKLKLSEEETTQNLYRDKYSRREWNFWR